MRFENKTCDPVSVGETRTSTPQKYSMQVQKQLGMSASPVVVILSENLLVKLIQTQCIAARRMKTAGYPFSGDGRLTRGGLRTSWDPSDCAERAVLEC